MTSSIFVTDVEDQMCWWLIKYIEKITNITKKVANIVILLPTSEISHHHKVTNITMSPTSLSPFWGRYYLVLLIRFLFWSYCSKTFSFSLTRPEIVTTSPPAGWLTSDPLILPLNDDVCDFNILTKFSIFFKLLYSSVLFFSKNKSESDFKSLYFK